MKKDRLFKTVLVIGDNHEEIIKKYSESYQVEPYLYLKREDAAKRKQQHIDELEKTISSGTLNQQQILLTKEYIEIIKETPYLEYFLYITKGFTYDIKMNDRKGFIKENIVIDFKKYDKSSQFKLPIVLEDKKTNEYYLKNNGYICK